MLMAGDTLLFFTLHLLVFIIIRNIDFLIQTDIFFMPHTLRKILYQTERYSPLVSKVRKNTVFYPDHRLKIRYS